MSEQDGQDALTEDTDVTVQTEDGEQPKADETPEGFISLDKHQKDVNTQHKRFRDEERGRIKQKERADRLQEKLDKLEAERNQVEIPPIPDRYDDKYQEKLELRDAAIRKQAENDAQAQRVEAERKKQQETAQAESDAALQERVKRFDKNMVDHGLNPADTKAAADQLVEYGLSEHLEDALLDDPDGPLFVQYLAQNPVELDGLASMTAYQLVRHLDGDIRQRAQLLKPKTSDAPPPPDVPDGGGAPETKEWWEKGATYS